MSTGVTVADQVVNQFNDFKLQRLPLRYIIYKIEGPEIVTDKEGASTATFADFIADLPTNDCRYAAYDMAFTTTDGRPGSKIVQIAWIPDSSKVKSKMTYAGSKDALTRAMVGVSTKINATDLSELTEEIIQDACRKFA